MAKNKIRISAGEKVGSTINLLLLIGFTFVCLFPLLNTLANAFSSDLAIAQGRVTLWPVEFQLDSMVLVATNAAVLRSLGVTVFVTVVGTAISMMLTILMAYPLSRKDLKHRNKMTFYALITMLFQAGMIPTFMVVNRLGLINNLLAIILPTAVSVWNLLILKTFFQSVPKELQESASIDGCGNWRILFQIMLPLSLPALATLSLFYAVGYWNSFMAAMIYINDPNLFTLQVRLWNLVVAGQMGALTAGADAEMVATLSPQALQASTVIFATVPILLVYPWLQKYFVKGVTIGAVKG